MRVRDPIEVFYLMLMHRWVTTAPPDGHQGALDGEPEQNSQVARLAYVLQKIAAGQVDSVFSRLEKLTTRRERPSYVSKDSAGMQEPRALWKGWYLEGCASMEQKCVIIRQLKQLGQSPQFVRAVDDFVSGQSIEKYFPTDDEALEILRQIEDREKAQDDVSR